MTRVVKSLYKIPLVLVHGMLAMAHPAYDFIGNIEKLHVHVQKIMVPGNKAMWVEIFLTMYLFGKKNC